MTDTVDATVVEEHGTHGTDMVPAAAAPPPSTLFGTDNPAEVLDRASVVAASLKDVLKTQGMVQSIKGKEYVKVEGWQTLGSMLGVVPVVAWTREVAGGWEARVEARTLDGRVVGAAESMCVADEGGNWGARATSNARRSMAQTRATSKALRGPLGFVVTLAGYQATPAEEMPRDDGPSPEPEWAIVDPRVVAEVRQAIKVAIDAEKVTPQAVKVMLMAAGAQDTSSMDKALGSMTLEQLVEFAEELKAEVGA